MPNVWAIKTGNWSDTTVWNTGTLPTASDAVFVSGSTFTVTIDQNINVASLNNIATGSIAVGGGFLLISSRTITASLANTGGGTALLTVTGSNITASILGSITGPGGNTSALNLPNTLRNSLINVNGNIIGGNALGGAVAINAISSIINITGSITGGTAGSATGLTGTTTGSTINIIGNITAGTQANAVGITVQGVSNTFNIIGNVTGNSSYGIHSTAASTSPIYSITGSILGGTVNNASGIVIQSTTGTYNISGSVTGGTGDMGINYQGTSNTINLTGSSAGGVAGNTNGITLSGTTNNLRITGNLLGGLNTPTTNAGLSITATAAYTASIFGDLITNIGSALLFNGASGVGTVNISGSVYAGLGSTYYGINTSNSTNFTLNITGSVYAGLSTNAYGINLANVATNSTITVRGNVFSTANTSYGIYNNSTAGVVVISGSVTAVNAIGVYNNTTGQILISGSAIAGAFVGAHNQSTGILRVISAVASTSSAALNGVNAGGTTTYENATFALNGNVPWLGYANMVSSSNNFISSSLEGNRYKILIDRNNIAQGLPAVSDVRLGTSYNSGANIGTLAMPSASQVLSGIPVDNTTGSAVITTESISAAVWNTLVSTLGTSGSVGERTRNISTVSSVGDQLTALI